jgi:hypothetical protein
VGKNLKGIVMLFEHEMAHLEQMNEELELGLEIYILFEKMYKLPPEQLSAISQFVEWLIKQNNEAIDEPRGKSCRTYREAANYP